MIKKKSQRFIVVG